MSTVGAVSVEETFYNYSDDEENDVDSTNVDIREPRTDEGVFVVYPSASAALDEEEGMVEVLPVGADAGVDIRSTAAEEEDEEGGSDS